MAEDEKVEFRDLNETDDKPYFTKSRAEQDLERRLDPEYKPESQIGGTVTVNPNPFGKGEYVGTDPIYQNSAVDQNEALASDEGVEAEALEALREEHDVDDDEAVDDSGLGGVARKAQADTDKRVSRYGANEADSTVEDESGSPEADDDDDENEPQGQSTPTPTPSNPSNPI